jgi:hypothetical protein
MFRTRDAEPGIALRRAVEPPPERAEPDRRDRFVLKVKL